MSRLKFSSLAFFAMGSKVANGCRNWWFFKSIGEKAFLLYSSITSTPYSLPTKVASILRFLYFKYKINANIL